MPLTVAAADRDVGLVSGRRPMKDGGSSPMAARISLRWRQAGHGNVVPEFRAKTFYLVHWRLGSLGLSLIGGKKPSLEMPNVVALGHHC